MEAESKLRAGGDSTEAEEGQFVPALIVVDMQEDFCPPVSAY